MSENKKITKRNAKIQKSRVKKKGNMTVDKSLLDQNRLQRMMLNLMLACHSDV